MKNNAIFVVGHYGVGKSAVIEEPVLDQDGFFLRTGENKWVLGTKIAGADSLSGFRKEEVIQSVMANRDKNIIITGNYYCQIKDIFTLSLYFKVSIIYLKTSFDVNKERIKDRSGNEINKDVYNAKIKGYRNLMLRTQSRARSYIIDNDQDLVQTRKEYNDILIQEQVI